MYVVIDFVQRTVTHFLFYKKKPYKNVKLHMPKSLEQSKNTLRLQRAIYLRTLSNTWFEPIIWSNIQILPQS